MCRSSLSERVEHGFSTYAMLEVLQFFDLAEEEEDIFEQYLEAAEFFLTRTNITSEDLSCKSCSVEEFRLLEVWYKRDLDIVLARNVRRVLKVFSK